MRRKMDRVGALSPDVYGVLLEFLTMRHLRNVFAFTAIVVLVLPSCDLPFGLGGDDAEDRLESNWEKWRRRGVPLITT